MHKILLGTLSVIILFSQSTYGQKAVKETEGWAVVEFTVTEKGNTKDIKVVEVHPATGEGSDAIAKSAVEAASGFKYRPKVIDGVPVKVEGVRHKVTFEIE